MSKENKNTVKEALLEMQNIKNAIKEESTSTIKELLGEAVKDAIRESISSEENCDGESCEDGKKKAASKKDTDNKDIIIDDVDADTDEDETSGEQDMDTEPEDADEKAPEVDDTDDENADVSKYDIGDGTYDITGVKDFNELFSILKNMDDGEMLAVKCEDGNLKVNDEETGAEYVIDLSDESDESETDELDESEEEIAGIPDGVEDEDSIPSEDDIEIDLGDEPEEDMRYKGFDTEDFKYSDDEPTHEFDTDEDEGEPMMEKKKNCMKKDALFEVDFGYTDNYQDKDVIKGLSNSEPSKSGRKIDAGVPDGTSKPWAGSTKGKGNPFMRTVSKGSEMNEEESMIDVDLEEPVEENCTTTLQNTRKMGTKSKVRANAKTPYGSKHVSHEEKYDETQPSGMNRGAAEMNEAYKKEIKSLKKAVNEMRQNFNDTYIACVNLGKITKLLMENSTTHDEKVDIVNRFGSESKSVEDAMKLYESISKELKNRKPKKMMAESKTATAKPVLNESSSKDVKSPELLKTLDLMRRVMEC